MGTGSGNNSRGHRAGRPVSASHRTLTLPVSQRAVWGVLLAAALFLIGYQAVTGAAAPNIRLEPAPTITVTVHGAAPSTSPAQTHNPDTGSGGAPAAGSTPGSPAAPIIPVDHSSAPPSPTPTPSAAESSPAPSTSASSRRPTPPASGSPSPSAPSAPLPLTATLGVAIPTRSPLLGLKAAITTPSAGNPPPLPIGIGLAARLDIAGITATVVLP